MSPAAQRTRSCGPWLSDQRVWEVLAPLALADGEVSGASLTGAQRPVFSDSDLKAIMSRAPRIAADHLGGDGEAVDPATAGPCRDPRHSRLRVLVMAVRAGRTGHVGEHLRRAGSADCPGR